MICCEGMFYGAKSNMCKMRVRAMRLIGGNSLNNFLLILASIAHISSLLRISYVLMSPYQCGTEKLSSGSTGTKALSSLVLLYIYLTHKWYISVLPKTDQLTFSSGLPFYPVLCNHSWTEFKLGRTNKTWLWVIGLNNYLNTCIVHQTSR